MWNKYKQKNNRLHVGCFFAFKPPRGGDNMRNTVDHIMEHAGVNDREFSLAIGVPHVVVWRARKGMTKTINPEILTTLEELGYDPAIIQAEY
jgi:uncharacterized membrane protein YqaE (UPF0057 family)